MRFEPTELGPEELALEREVRDFLASELSRGTFAPGLGMSAPKDPVFSRKLAARGWVGMALPRRHGGHDRSAVDRFVVVEELLRWGAPVGHHWVADRQSGPVIERFGTDEQKSRFLPAICGAELSFSIGMSEPDAGSDLAAVSTRATRADGGWLVNGTKIWTSGASENDWFIVLCRTGAPEGGDRHEGLSQLLVDLRSPGLEVRPIRFIDGTASFNEVVLHDVFVPDELVLGEVGRGWSQVSSELAYERGGPDRWLSPWLLVEEYLRTRGGRFPDERAREVVGDLVGRWWGIRLLSLSVARLLDRGAAPAVESALVKELGTRFEQEVLEQVRSLVDLEPAADAGPRFERLLAALTLNAPSFTVRGGTVEVLRSVAAKGLDGSPAPGAPPGADPVLVDAVTRLLGETATHRAVQAAEADGWAPALWEAFAGAGLPWISVPEEAGGSGGTLADALAVLWLVGAHGAPVPAAETGVLGGWLLAGAGLPVPTGPVTVVPGRPGDDLALSGPPSGPVLSGTASRVPWARAAERVVVLAPLAGRWMVASVPVAAIAVEPHANLAGEPRDTVTFSGVRLGGDDLAPAAAGVDADALRRRGALARAVQMAGALDRTSRLTVAYANERRQFGRPVSRFQAVQEHLVRLAQAAALVGVGAAVAARSADRGPAPFEVAAAKLVASRAVPLATAAAHQAHGAMGLTQEYPLLHLSRRLWAWRHEFGDERHWAGVVGRLAEAVGADGLYPLVTGGSAALPLAQRTEA